MTKITENLEKSWVIGIDVCEDLSSYKVYEKDIWVKTICRIMTNNKTSGIIKIPIYVISPERISFKSIGLLQELNLANNLATIKLIPTEIPEAFAKYSLHMDIVKRGEEMFSIRGCYLIPDNIEQP